MIICFLVVSRLSCSSFFFFNDTATTEIYTLSLHDALPISWSKASQRFKKYFCCTAAANTAKILLRSEEHTSELQSQSNLVCRLLLEKKKKKKKYHVPVSILLHRGQVQVHQSYMIVTVQAIV